MDDSMLAGAQCVLQLATLAGAGAWLRMKGLLDEQVTRKFSQFTVSAFLPCLIFSRLAAIPSLHQLGSVYALLLLPCTALVNAALGAALGVLTRRVFLRFEGQPKEGAVIVDDLEAGDAEAGEQAGLLRQSFSRAYVLGCAIGNSTTMPIVLAAAVATSFPQFRALPHSLQEMTSLVSLYIPTMHLLLWLVGYNYLRTGPREADDVAAKAKPVSGDSNTQQQNQHQPDADTPPTKDEQHNADKQTPGITCSSSTRTASSQQLPNGTEAEGATDTLPQKTEEAIRIAQRQDEEVDDGTGAPGRHNHKSKPNREDDSARLIALAPNTTTRRLRCWRISVRPPRLMVVAVRRCAATAAEVCNPPLVAIALGLGVHLFPWLVRLLVPTPANPAPSLGFLWQSASIFGNGVVTLSSIVLGSVAYGSHVKFRDRSAADRQALRRAAVCMCAVRQLLLPVLGLLLMRVVVVGEDDSDDGDGVTVSATLRLVLVLEFATPTANMVVTLANVLHAGAEELAYCLLWQVVLGFATLVFVLSAAVHLAFL